MTKFMGILKVIGKRSLKRVVQLKLKGKRQIKFKTKVAQPTIEWIRENDAYSALLCDNSQVRLV